MISTTEPFAFAGGDLKPLGKPVPVFGLRPVYEFDVDADGVLHPLR